MCAGAVRDVGGCQIDHQQSPLRVDRDMPLAADDLLSGVIAARLCVRCLDRLTVDNRRRWACVASLSFPTEHKLDIMDRLEQKAPRQVAEPAIDCSPVTEMHRQPFVAGRRAA